MSKLAIALTTTVALTSSASRLVRHLAAHAVGLGSPAGRRGAASTSRPTPLLINFAIRALIRRLP
jgi:hypothetical protein